MRGAALRPRSRTESAARGRFPGNDAPADRRRERPRQGVGSDPAPS